ncbi:hypothetical protein F383_22289 [Gossypium arboreum]|uniref:Uncharacterized protein n=1 Tax=Gossypium arboreum TaxID=29729 RepID=A0A0B0NXL1_GOSAR|nr:hypothetical protein F383_22289 [Gossypium arboreum]
MVKIWSRSHQSSIIVTERRSNESSNFIAYEPQSAAEHSALFRSTPLKDPGQCRKT